MTTITRFAETPDLTSPTADQLYHASCRADSQWPAFAVIDAELDDRPPGFVGASVTDVDGALMLVGVGTDGELYHTIGNPDGRWQDFVGLRDGLVGGGPRDFYAAASGNCGGVFHVVGLGSDGLLYHAASKPGRGWQGEFERIDPQLPGGPPAFAAAACAGIEDSLHLVALDTSGQACHAVHHPDGGWQSFRGLGQLYDAPSRFVAIDCAALSDGSLHIVGVGSDARLHHTIRFPDGSWQRYFGVLGGQQYGVVPRFTLSVACAAVGPVLGLVAISSDHRLFHFTRAPDGSWRGSPRFGEGQLRNGSPEFYGVSCASTGEALHVVGGTWQGGFA